MKWYLLLHIFNLYAMPIAGYLILIGIYTVIDFADYGMSFLFGYIPLGCFFISSVYGFRKRKSFLSYCIVCSLFCIPLTFPDLVSGDGIANHITGALTFYSIYFSMAFMGNIAGYIIYLGYRAVKKMLSG